MQYMINQMNRINRRDRAACAAQDHKEKEVAASAIEHSKPSSEEGTIMNLVTRVSKLLVRRSARTAAFNQAVDMALESLEGRRMFAVTAISAGGVLTVLGDNNDNSITISRDAVGGLLVNNGTVAIKGGPATVSNTRLIQTFGRAGDDTIVIDDTNGALPKADLFGSPAAPATIRPSASPATIA
jgi:hypothetical protein